MDNWLIHSTGTWRSTAHSLWGSGADCNNWLEGNSSIDSSEKNNLDKPMETITPIVHQSRTSKLIYARSQWNVIQTELAEKWKLPLLTILEWKELWKKKPNVKYL
jgi:hypothetical protein